MSVILCKMLAHVDQADVFFLRYSRTKNVFGFFIWYLYTGKHEVAAH